jgi:hypothetical protein
MKSSILFSIAVLVSILFIISSVISSEKENKEREYKEARESAIKAIYVPRPIYPEPINYTILGTDVITK